MRSVASAASCAARGLARFEPAQSAIMRSPGGFGENLSVVLRLRTVDDTDYVLVKAENLAAAAAALGEAGYTVDGVGPSDR